ncbi:hypothetical protein VTN00DRAFT_2856 [Thermoascus crustaceus]|uniref:uncharacterized protein n=1 Tax=Thermoascus crustaceus TaxID=5088 RepID=UPI0037430A7D
MLRPYRPQLRQLLPYHDYGRLSERAIASSRLFSSTSVQADEGASEPTAGSAIPGKNSTTPGSLPADNRGKFSGVKSNAGASNTDKNRPRRIVDARALAAPRAGGQPDNLLRAPRLWKLRSGQLGRGRRPGATTMAVNAKRRSAGRGPRPKSVRRQTEEEDGDDTRAAQIEDFYREQAEEKRPKSIRYDPPQDYNASMLRDTWPSLPVGEMARTGSVLEKLSWMSSRFPNGYEPPHELAKRLFEGKRVLFTSEEEKAQAMEEAKKLAQERADKLSQRKGDLVEPEDTNFVSVGTEERKALIEGLVQGKYPTLKPLPAGKPPVIGDVLRNLRNNETYQTAGKSSQFLSKLESLLASGQRPKRAS